MSQHTLKSKSLGGTAAALMLAAAFSAAGSAPAQAQTTGLFSGGGTFAEKVYRDIMNCYGNHDGTDLTFGLNAPPATCNAAAPYRANVELHYVGSGSGRGLLSFTLGDTQQFNIGRVPDAVPVPSSTSFGPFYGTGAGSTWVRADSNGTGGTNKFPRLSFAGSDDPLTAAQIATYNAHSAGWGAPIQFPALIGAVAIPFNPSADGFTEKGKKPAGGNNNSDTTGYSSLVDFSTNTLCGIFTGQITDWSDHRIKADNSNTALVGGPVDGNTHPITVVYRNDSSGTTFLFTNGLVNQCAETATPVPASWQTAVNGAAHNNAGKGDNSWYINVAAAGLFPAGAHFVGAAGSGGVQAAIGSPNAVPPLPGTPGSVGYISTDFVLPIDKGHAVKAANLQTYASLHNGLPAVFRAPNSKNGVQIVGSAKPPLNKAASCPVGTDVGQAPDGNCAHNPLNWGSTFPKPISASAYPIGGFTFVDTYTCYANAADVDALVGTGAGHLGYLRWYFGSVTENSSLVKNALAANGFSPVPGSWLGSIKKILTTDKVTKIAQAGVGTVKTNPSCFSAVGGA